MEKKITDFSKGLYFVSEGFKKEIKILYSFGVL